MKIVVTYIAVVNGPNTHELCARFCGTWLQYPPGVECELLVCCNGGPLPTETALLFMPLGARFFPRANDEGRDISGYQAVAKQTDADMLVCFGESVYLHREGYLLHLALAWKRYGAGFYGCFSSGLVRYHMNTTAFACAPVHLIHYPPVKTHADRYEFEHGPHSLWRRLALAGVPTRLVTFDGTYEPKQWRTPKEILWRGNQSALLVQANHTDRYRAASEATKREWERAIDAPYR